jgi:hypothetical protein
MTDQKLVDELEKALRDEAYDGGFGYMGDEQFTAYVRTLAETGAEVVEKAHTPTDDEREALAQWLHLRFGQNPSHDWANVAERHKAAWRDVAADAPLRHTEVPEPSAEHGTPPDYQAYELTVDMLEDLLVAAGVSASEHGIAIRKTAAALVYKIGRRLALGPQGEPSDAQVQAALVAHLGYDPAPAGFPFKAEEIEQMRAALLAAFRHEATHG